MVSIILERDLERYFTQQCKKLKLKTLKINVRFQRGWPDRLVLLPDQKVLWVELKRPGGKTSALQDKTHAEMLVEGHYVHIIDSKEGIDNVLASA